MSERLRHLVESHPFQYEDRRYNITVSLGLVSTEGDESLTPNDLIKQADEKLYQAKHDGRKNENGYSLFCWREAESLSRFTEFETPVVLNHE